MSRLIFNNCCFLADFRLATIIIACVCLAFELISLVFNSLTIWVYNFWTIVNTEHVSGLILLRFLAFLFMFITCLKLFLCVTLFVGIFKRMPDHLEIWYKGYAFFECFYLALIILETALAAKRAGYMNVEYASNVPFCFILGGKYLITVITLLLIIVVRCYYQQMRKETNFYQYSSHQDKNGYSAREEITKEDTGLYPNLSEEIKYIAPSIVKNAKGGQVFSTPNSLPSTYVDNDKIPILAQNKHVKFSDEMNMMSN